MGRFDKSNEGDEVAYSRFSPIGKGIVLRALLGSGYPVALPAYAMGRTDGGERQHRRDRVAGAAGHQR